MKAKPEKLLWGVPFAHEVVEKSKKERHKTRQMDLRELFKNLASFRFKQKDEYAACGACRNRQEKKKRAIGEKESRRSIDEKCGEYLSHAVQGGG